MKKNLTLILLAVMMVLGLTACANSNQNANDNANKISKEDSKVAEKQKEPSKVTIYLVRHGKTILNNTDRVQGWADGPLIPSGEELIKNVGKGLANVPFIGAYSSDSGRAIQTANLILAENTSAKDLKLIQKPGIREAYFGIYEGELNKVMWDEAAKHKGYNNSAEMFAAGGNPIETLLNGVSDLDAEAESYQELTDRASNEFKAISEEAYQNGGGDVLVVSHGITMAAILAVIDPSKVMPEGFKNGSVTKFEFDGKDWKILEINEMKYAE
ncbi:hypothetical protein AM233_04980 [Bacillus sp. FJAT-22058]|nr:hypothetical protein AM233_04980 [Bacillus sp. FJAT-22058]